MMRPSPLLMVGLLALVIGLAVGALSAVVYGEEMAPNLLAELAGLPIEVALFVLVVDRLMAHQRRKDWRCAYDAVSARLAVTFVDVMRLLYVRSSEQAYKANVSRYDEFVGLAELHLDELRSNIEGFAVALEPKPHENSRKVDRRLSWAIRELAASPVQPGLTAGVVDLMRDTGDVLFRFLRDNDGRQRSADLAAAFAAVERARDEHGRVEGDGQSPFQWRLAAQDHLLAHAAKRRRLTSIAVDIDHEWAIPYFFIDHFVLQELATQSGAVGGRRSG